MNREYRMNVQKAVASRPHLVPVLHSTLNVPERVYEYDRQMFVVRNTDADRYEVHSMGHKGKDSLALVSPYRHLDARLLYRLRECDLRTRGEEIFREVEKSEERAEKANRRKFQNWIEDVGSETQSMFAKDAWTLGT